MTDKLNPKRAFGSLFTSLIIHLIFFIILGFIFLKGKPYEEYVEVDFTSPLPESKRKLQSRKPIKSLTVPNYSNYKNVVRVRTPEVTTVAKVDSYSDVYLSSATDRNVKNAKINIPKINRITTSKTKVQSKTEASFVKPEIKPRVEIEISSASDTMSAELKLPSDLGISEKFDLDANAIQKYREAIKKRIEEEKRYPEFAEENGYEGKVSVRFKLFADGRVEAVKISKSSGYQILDREAVRAVTNAVPYPPMPESIKREYIIIEVPIVFRLS